MSFEDWLRKMPISHSEMKGFHRQIQKPPSRKGMLKIQVAAFVAETLSRIQQESKRRH